MRRSALWGAGAVAFALYGHGACTTPAENGPSAVGSSSLSSTSGVTTLTSGSSSSSASSGAGGSGSCGPTEWPAAIPSDWKEFTDWSCKCRFYYPPDPGKMLPALAWDTCPDSGTGIDCRFARTDWSSEPTSLSVGSVRIAGGGKTLLLLQRNEMGRAVEEVAEVDGVVRFAIARPYFPKDSSTDAGCVLSAEDLEEDHYVLRVFGDDAASGMGLESQHVGALGSSLQSPAIHVLAHYTDKLVRSWWVSAKWVARIDSTTLKLYVSPWTMGKDIVVTSPEIDPMGIISSQQRMVGDTLFWVTSTLYHDGINVWEPVGGARPFVRWIGDYTKGAGDLGTDGVDLVWTYGEGKQSNDEVYPKRSIMTAPFTGDPKKVTATQKRLRSAPDSCVGCYPYAVNCGYALHRGNANDVLVVRLSDGWSWYLPKTPKLFLQSPIGIDCQDVFVGGYWDGKNQIVRVKINSLGPGMAPD